MSAPGDVTWYTIIRRLMGRPEQIGADSGPLTGRELGTGPEALERPPSSASVALTGILGLGLVGLAVFLGIMGLVLIAIVVGLIGLALTGAAIAGWRQHPG
ncbi:MAG TPA: hypothetical protein VGL18_11115 [Actinomycetota bacterium]|jgi:hypothetical protein